jgi:outer membrane protein assembly factor BamB
MTLSCPAADWPTFRHDNRRSAVSTEQLAAPLKQAWLYKSPAPPQTAWAGPAKWDAFSGNADLQSMRNFDPAFFATAVGDTMWYGSSVDNAVHAVDAASGKEKWVFFTGAAVRFPPTHHEGRLYFGSDDGFAYCADAATGKEIWRFRPVEDDRHVPSNGKLISLWPCRTGVLIDDGRAYFGASLLPWEASYLCAVDIKTGKPDGDGCFAAKQNGVTLQGALLASSERIYVPQGRSAPLRYALASGKSMGSVPGAGGTYCLLTPEEQLVAGPGNQKNKDHVLSLADGAKARNLLNFNGTNRILISGNKAYLHASGVLTALDRQRFVELRSSQKQLLDQQKALKKRKAPPTELSAVATKLAKVAAELPKCYLWKQKKQLPIGFAMGGKTLFVGGDGVIEAVNAETGATLWTAPVGGKAYGLAIANGRLFVSTDRGHIYCFSK